MERLLLEDFDDSSVYLWGCGKYGMLQATWMEENGLRPKAFIDNDIKKADTDIIDNICCIYPDSLVIENNVMCIICIRLNNIEAIYEQAQMIGFKRVYIADFDLLDSYANGLDDKTYLERIWKIKQGYELNWNSPQTFNEKLQWLKLYNRKREYCTMVDKYESKIYVASKIGSEYIIPTIGVWDNANQIDFDGLPNRFVLKCTHDSGGVIICKDKRRFDYQEAIKKINAGLNISFYHHLREWPYKYVKPRVIAEEYMEDSIDGELRDYKMYTFNGKVKYMLIASNRNSATETMTFDYFDVEGNHLSLVNHYHPNAKTVPHLPNGYRRMIEFAEVLGKEIPHLRVDFYEVDKKIFFGELTFFDMGGFLKIHPDEWDVEWGKLIELPKEKIE